MLPLTRQVELVRDLASLPDPYARINALLDRAAAVPPFGAGERIEANRVPSCLARVWFLASFADGRCRFRADAEAATVRALALVLCALYDGAPPVEVANFEPTFLAELGLDHHLTPTRTRALVSLRAALRGFAQARLVSRNPWAPLPPCP